MYLWTSEAVSCGHPDKLADQVADAVLDAHLAQDPLARVACEVTLTPHLAIVTGEITSQAKVNVEQITRSVLCDVGYKSNDVFYDGNRVAVLNTITQQSPQISGAVTKDDGQLGAGDQGMMFGYATADHKPSFMPLSHHLAFRLIGLQERLAKSGELPLYPDAKSQVTLEYRQNQARHGWAPYCINTIVFSTQHPDSISLEELRGKLKPLIEQEVVQFSKSNDYSLLQSLGQAKILINPAGSWQIGGPAADTGLTGRKIVVDNYGADCPIGGGSFSGKDPTKVDRSAAYAARHIAKNIVAKDLAHTCRVQLAYAIGVVQPVSVNIETDGHANEKLTKRIMDNVDLSPKGIIDRLKLRRPIYQRAASGGHFGRSDFPWEQIDLDF